MNRLHFTGSVAALVAASAPLLAQGSQSEGVFDLAPNLSSLLSSWQAQHGEPWRLNADEGTGHAELLFGGSAPAPFTPQTDQEWAQVAREFVVQTADFHGISSGELEEQWVRFLPLSMASGSTDKLTVRFRQTLDGLTVEGASVNVLMAMDGSLLSVHSTASPFLAGLSTSPSLAPNRAAELAAREFARLAGVAPSSVGEPELLIDQVEGPAGRLPRLAYRVATFWEQPDTHPEGYDVYVDARTGAILDAAATVHDLDVGGTLSSMATPGTLPDKGSNPEVSKPMPFARITSSAGTTFTDANGNWNYPGVSGPLNVTVEYRGDFSRVFNQSGAEYTQSFPASTGQGNNIVMNQGTSDLVTAQANAFIETVATRNYIRNVNPTDGTADFVAIANTNISSNCNAYFDGSSINFYTAGGGCVNTSYSTVVAHEFGHWLNVLYGTGNGSDGMGEGNADVFAMYVYDTPVVGEDFCGTGCDIRTGLNTRQFCGDCCGGCYGQVHADGEVWMGAAWKVRRNLNQTLGDSAGDMTADALFMGWMNAYNQTEIKSIIEEQWLTLDDDDGNIGNGTPNYADIDDAFLEQGFPGFELDFVQFSDVTELPDTLDESGPYIVEADVTALITPPLTGVNLHYRVDGGSFATAPMASIGGDTYQGVIPGQAAPAEVDYYVSGTDSAGNTDTFPPDAPDGTLSFRVGLVTVFLENDFEGATDEGWSVGDVGDDATTGIWERGDPRGTEAQPEDDHTASPGTQAWFTGQGSIGGSLGENDVDDGKTTLKTPVFDAADLETPKLSYWRWYSNDKGASPNADVFEVDISNDGGSTWTNVETVGPADAESNGGWFRHEFEVASVITPTATMQLRFIASDEGSGSIVEAAVDDVEGYSVGPACPVPIEYGDAKPNSQLVLPMIGWSGTSSFSADDFEIEVLTLVANQTAVLFSGTESASVPFFGGFRLVGGTIVREALASMDGSGYVSVPVPIEAGMIGSTLYYQYWYRDPLHPDGTGVGLSNALEVEFCD